MYSELPDPRSQGDLTSYLQMVVSPHAIMLPWGQLRTLMGRALEHWLLSPLPPGPWFWPRLQGELF